MKKFVLVKKEIEKILANSPLDFDVIHARLVLKWLLKLKPDANEALKIAALAHDMERGITGITEKDLKDYSKIGEFKKEHAIRSAKYICEILRKHGYAESFIEKVMVLVESHEEGGNNDSDLLMSADSLAYFEYNVPFTLARYGAERTKQKIGFMYKRLPDKAKKLLKKMKFKNKGISNLFKEVVSEA